MKQIQIFFLLLLGSTLFAALPSGQDMPCPFSAFATNYDDCAASCFGYYTECNIGACERHCRSLFCTASQGEIQVCRMNWCLDVESSQLDECIDVCLEQTEKWDCSGGGTDVPTDLCANVQCYDPYCDGNERVTCDCDETTGGCVCTAVLCPQGCDPATAQCIDYTPTDLCANVQCDDPYCDGNELVTCDCDETTGQCVCSAFWCAQDCDPATLQCTETEINTVPANIDILGYLGDDDQGYVILQEKGGENKPSLIVSAFYPDETPATGARVHVRLTDPKQTGVLGPWGFRDAVFFIDSSGFAHGELEFPTLRNIKEYHWDEFPYDIQMDVTVSMHDNLNDWSVTKSVQIELRSPAPRILEISINPNPAQSAENHVVSVTIEDPDSTELTYIFKSSGGKWTTSHPGALEGSAGLVYAFTSYNTYEFLEWEAPARGLTTEEISYAKNLFNIVTDVFIVGPTQAKINADAALERLDGEAMSDEMSMVIMVRNSDGFYDREYYDFQMEYLGFKPEEGG
ncbi:MAG: hypothetical protein GY852_08900 [bacterium]|nr:hypothetical protein [bacterium]